MNTRTSTTAQLTPRERWLTTALLGLGLITFAVDASNTQLVLPQIMTNMRVELYQIHWLLTAPGIIRTVLTASTGWLGGWFGPRTLYLLSIGCLSVGSLGTMLAWDWSSLLFFRILSGMGGGMIPPLSQAIFYQIFPPGQRGMALGFSLMGWSIGPAFGPLLGGNLLEMGSWRAVYTVTLPMSVLGFLMAWVWLPPLGRPERRRLDYYGALTMTVAVSTLLLALSQGNREGWDDPYILLLFATAAVATVAFVVIELCHPQPLVELRLFGSVPFVMAMIVLFFTTMTFRGTGPMMGVLMQRLLGFEPIRVAWAQMLPNLIYGAAVLVVGRVSDRVPTYVLVVGGLLMYIGTFLGFTGVNEVTTFGMLMTFMIIRFVAEAFIVSPNNLATLEALPENKVYMATGLTGLLRSVANTMGTAIAAVIWDVRYNYHQQRFAEATPMDAEGFSTAMSRWQNTLRWSGEEAAQIPAQTQSLLQNRLLAEATTAAWQDYFLFNAFLALLCVLPALPFWKRTKYAVPTAEPLETSARMSIMAPASNNGTAVVHHGAQSASGRTS